MNDLTNAPDEYLCKALKEADTWKRTGIIKDGIFTEFTLNHQQEHQFWSLLDTIRVLHQETARRWLELQDVTVEEKHECYDCMLEETESEGEIIKVACGHYLCKDCRGDSYGPPCDDCDGYADNCYYSLEAK